MDCGIGCVDCCCADWIQLGGCEMNDVRCEILMNAYTSNIRLLLCVNAYVYMIIGSFDH